MRVAGLAAVEGIQGLENIDVTKLVNGHMAYRAAMPRLLREVGWEVESDEFTEIEDPDPENHETRQRELIREIDEARKDAEAKPEKKRFGFFKRGKLAEKKTWETYDDSMRAKEEGPRASTEGPPNNVLFDIEAIRSELATDHVEVKQLESTLPPMKLDLSSSPDLNGSQQNPYANLRETKSYDATMASRPKAESQASLPKSQIPNPFDQGYDDWEPRESSEGQTGSQERITMSFDSPRRSPSPIKSLPPLAEPPGSASHEHTTFEKPSESPGFGNKLSLAVSTSANGLAVEHNAWAEDEDEDFGKEKDITMTWA